MNFIERIIGLITSPDKTMGEISKEPKIEEAVVIVALLAVVTAISTYLSTSHIKYVFTDSSLEGMSGLITAFSVVAGLILPFIFWVIITAVLYLFSMVFGGEGKFLTLLAGVGYSQLPKIFVAIIVALLITQTPVITAEISASGQTRILEGGEGNSLLSLLQQAVTLIGLLWSCVIGVFAVKYILKLSTKTAALVVGIPLVIYLVATYGLAFIFGGLI